MRHITRDQAENHIREYGFLLLLAGNTSGLMKTRKADFKIITVLPGETTSHHFHLERETLVQVLDGQLVLKCVSANIENNLKADDIVILDPGEDHAFINRSTSPASYLEVESPPYSSKDRILFSDPPDRLNRPIGKFWKDSSKTRIKICGVKSLDAACACWDIGVDAIGIHGVGRHWQRAINYLEWLTVVPEDLSIFLLTDIVEIKLLSSILNRLKCDTLQIQGEKSVKEIQMSAIAVRELGYKVVKSIAVPGRKDIQATLKFIEKVSPFLDAVLLDSSWEGGSGISSDWDIVRQLTGSINIPVIVAGGISPDNIHDLNRTIGPYGFDIESAVEWRFSSDGQRITAKNISKIQELITALNP